MSGSSANKLLFGYTKPGPAGTRPPPVNWGLIGLRLLIVVCLLVSAARPSLLAWATSVPPLPQTTVRPTVGPRPPPLPPIQRIVAIGAQAVRTVLRPPAFSIIWGIGLVGLAGVALELALAAARLVAHTAALRRAAVIYLRIRLPHTTAGRGVTSGGRDPGTDLLRAIHELLPAHGAPWLALTLGARPDEPAELGVAVGGGSRREREGWAAALRKVVTGQSPEALVEVAPDPLAARLAPGVRVAWRVWLPSQPPAYPLRLHTDTDRADLLGPLAAAVAPRAGTSYGEVQIVLRPHRGWDLTQGWRAQALRRRSQRTGR